MQKSRKERFDIIVLLLKDNLEYLNHNIFCSNFLVCSNYFETLVLNYQSEQFSNLSSPSYTNKM